MQTTVFLPSIPMRWDETREIRRPTFDLTPVRQYGRAVVLVPENKDYDLTDLFDVQPVVDLIKAGLADSTEDDYIVAIGDPVLICAAAAVQVQRHNNVRMLRWDRLQQRYKIMEFQL